MVPKNEHTWGGFLPPCGKFLPFIITLYLKKQTYSQTDFRFLTEAASILWNYHSPPRPADTSCRPYIQPYPLASCLVRSCTSHQHPAPAGWLLRIHTYVPKGDSVSWPAAPECSWEAPPPPQPGHPGAARLHLVQQVLSVTLTSLLDARVSWPGWLRP